MAMTLSDPLSPAACEELLWNGIAPPKHGHFRTRCPECSHTRKRKNHNCLRIFEHDLTVDVYCHHCGWENSFVKGST